MGPGKGENRREPRVPHQKPSAAVWRIAERGDVVQIEPRSEGNFIENLKMSKKAQKVRKDGSCVTDAEFLTNNDGFAGQASMT